MGFHFNRMKYLAALVFGAAVVMAPARAVAQARGESASVTAEDQKKAQEHFHRARELYQAGRYNDAVTELETARRLDPKAKDLVMNLGIVHEKLGKYDEAIGYLRAFVEMDGVTPSERAKAESMIKRIEGARRSAAKKEPPPKEAPVVKPAPPSPAQTTEAVKPSAPARGRIDAWTIVAGSVSAAGFLTLAGAGAYAVATRPGDDYVTGRDGTFTDLEDQSAKAHRAALVADIGLGVGVVAAIATLWLYFGRTKDADARAFTAPRIGTF